VRGIYEEQDTVADGATVKVRRDAPWRGVRSEATAYASTTVGAEGAKSDRTTFVTTHVKTWRTIMSMRWYNRASSYAGNLSKP